MLNVGCLNRGNIYRIVVSYMERASQRKHSPKVNCVGFLQLLMGIVDGETIRERDMVGFL